MALCNVKAEVQGVLSYSGTTILFTILSSSPINTVCCWRYAVRSNMHRGVHRDGCITWWTSSTCIILLFSTHVSTHDILHSWDNTIALQYNHLRLLRESARQRESVCTHVYKKLSSQTEWGLRSQRRDSTRGQYYIICQTYKFDHMCMCNTPHRANIQYSALLYIQW